MVTDREADDALARYQKIHELAERRSEKRRRRLRRFWGLILVALALGVATIVVSYLKSADMASDVASEVVDKPEFRQQVTAQVRAEVAPQVRELAPMVASAVTADPGFAASVQGMFAQPEDHSAAIQALRRAVALRPGPIDPAQLTYLRARLDSLETSAEQADRELRTDLDTSLDELSDNLSSLDERSASQARRLEELAGELEELRRLVLPSLSYVVKASAQTRIPELGIMVEIGRIEDRSVAGVRVWDSTQQRQLYPEEPAGSAVVRLGEPLGFETEEYRYRLTLGYSVNRWVARDLIGLEVRRFPR